MSKSFKTPARPTHGIVCLEGSWGEKLDSRESIEPALRCVESFGVASVIHKDVATRSELEHYVDQWLGKSGRAMPAYRMGMFAFHGNRNQIYLGADVITLSELAEVIGPRAGGRIIYLGGCEVLALPEDQLMDFCRRTNARGVVGYTKAVAFLETVAFEMMLIEATLGMTSFAPIYNRLCREHPAWTRKLGLRMAHAKWASPRVIA